MDIDTIRVELTPVGYAYLAGYDEGRAGQPPRPEGTPALRDAYLTGYEAGIQGAQQPPPAA